MHQYTPNPSSLRVLHEPGEVILAGIGNFLEDPDADRKPRPVVILASGECQHTVAGLTTQGRYATTGRRRRPIPNPKACGLDEPGFLWSPRPSRLSRIDVIRHVGWIDHALALAIAEGMDVSPAVFAGLWYAAQRHHPRGRQGTGGSADAGLAL